ncbi:Maf family protein [uncultured Jatrophihabitans sp.]|uniref:Maf family protein n=1 Tax=uncultured Jatrophihabitans sp. TaxID=1610747 RepID=UPI0035CC8C9A
MTASRGLVTFVLASQSPARLATLRRAGVEPEVIVSGVDEDAVDAPTTAELVTRLAVVKAQAVADRCPDALVLGCDSLLDLDGVALGKPGTPDAARDRWRQMRGRTAALHTGHHLIDTATGRSVTRAVATRLRFAEVTDDEIDAYCATGEPSAVAGAFTIDGLGGWFVERIDGDPHNVVGLSLPTVRAMLHELGHSLASIGYPASD